jgi:putative ABC transport system substrate-binding protein
VKRREFITLLGGAAAWPAAAQAQVRTMPVVGWVNTGSAAQWAHLLVGFRQGLTETGYVEGRNVAIEYCWADEQYDRLAPCIAELVARKVAVIVASPLPAARAAKAAAPAIPTVFQIGADPVRTGLVASFNRPGGNLTGVSQLSTALVAKRLGLLHEIAANPNLIAVLVDPQAGNREEQLTILQDAARALGVRTLMVDSRDIDTAFAILVSHRADALFVAASSYWVSHREQIVSLAARHRVPASYEDREFTRAGGLMSYGTDSPAVYRQVGIYAGRILAGEKPSDLPVVQPTKFELVLNLKTAKTLGIAIPGNLLALADEVIE